MEARGTMTKTWFCLSRQSATRGRTPSHWTRPARRSPGEDRIWLQNTKAWSRILNSIEGQKSNFLFFDGDMIMGYGWAKAPTDATVNGIVGSDLMKFYRQYGFWRGMVAGLMQNGPYVVPVPGNHETQCTACRNHPTIENEHPCQPNIR